ncbi:MAG: AraC family transcriptional regulator [Hydrocarboniphaga sp.]|uniref:AraC family transcriptional regulator n=1 Tax=Hydrocarboniphaga sp. TaxID=2033016 RepID=UPI0026215F78|nr:AraC family transcriptional regulator [Hydrocarboniphaga sp.]MDB5967751.1 AraC family transcriptional regulator [Hydrocarboniphaga sp.]
MEHKPRPAAEDTSQSVDSVLEAVLSSYQLRVEITANVRYCGTWFEQEPATRFGQFHLITDGGCWVSGSALASPEQLFRGDLIVFPTGTRHSLSASRDPHLPEPSEDAGTSMLCGELEFIMGMRNPIFTALPPCFIVRAAQSSGAFRQLADMLVATSTDRRWGRQMVQNKLADSLFTMAVCEYVRSAGEPRGLLAALTDVRLSKALAAVHERPGDEWTIQSMAQVAGMSRTAFAELFTQTVGQPPIQYLSNWRATEARRLLKNRRYSVASIAEMMGYRSEAAFRRFFKRVDGVGPGKVRANRDEESDS